MRTTLPLLLLLLLCACGERDTSGWTPVETSAMSESQKAQRVRGLDAKKALFGGLIARLGQAMGEGPEKAIHVCNAAAPSITERTSNDHGLRIGRTSHRLRNPKNAPPAWATRYVAKERDKPIWLAHEDGRLAGLLPIPTMGMCLRCHGPWKDIEQPIRRALADLYPEDRAYGFQTGDIRGWFWIEVP